MTMRIRVGLTALAASGMLVLAACSAASTPATSGGSSAGFSTPFAPLATEPAASTSDDGTTAASVTVMPSTPEGPHNQADITFVSTMIVHHQGAVEMADLAAGRASSSEIKDLAARIKAAQEAEITEMSRWLAAWAPTGADTAPDTDLSGMPSSTSVAMGGMPGMDHGDDTSAMPGVMSDEQMGQLTAASGPAFDKLFLQLMIVHHQGALEMAGAEKSQGSNPSALQLADSVITDQTAEIATMQDLLETL